MRPHLLTPAHPLLPDVLYDNVEGEDASDLLHWRREGEAWEPPAAEEGADGEAAPLSLGDIVQQISAAER